jgi:RHS repeat-associated protein
VTTGYDGYARLISYVRTGTSALTFTYNGLDDRVSQTSGAVVTRYLYDNDGRVLGEYGASALDVKAEYLWLNPEVDDAGAFGGDDGAGGYTPLAINSAPTGGSALLSWVHANHLGAPLATTNATGAEITPTGYTALAFPGQMKTLADVWYNRYRDYDPTTGRYIQADPIGLDGGDNPYSYAENNPLRYIDPSGLSAAGTVGGVLGGVVAGAITRNPNGARWGATVGRAAGELINSLCVGDDKCKALYEQIAEARIQLTKRLEDFRRDANSLPNGPGRNTRRGHADQFSGWQARLRRLLLEADALGCKAYPSDSWHFATMKLDSRF